MLLLPLLLAASAPQATPGERIPASEANQGVAAGMRYV